MTGSVCDDGGSETDYAKHHIQKSSWFFCRHASFLFDLAKKHEVIYIYLNDEDNLQSLIKNIKV
jgi:deoxyribodipyrimidine photolyase-related protein